MGIPRSWGFSFTLCGSQSKLQNLMGKERGGRVVEGGSWQCKRSIFQVALVAASEPNNREPVRLGR